MIPAWALKAFSVVLALASTTGFFGYVRAHVKPVHAPLHPQVVGVLVERIEEAPPPDDPDPEAADAAAAAPKPTTVVVIVRVPAKPAGPAQGISDWIKQTGVAPATTTYAS
jgi:hypothetical protein